VPAAGKPAGRLPNPEHFDKLSAGYASQQQLNRSYPGWLQKRLENHSLFPAIVIIRQKKK